MKYAQESRTFLLFAVIMFVSAFFTYHNTARSPGDFKKVVIDAPLSAEEITVLVMKKAEAFYGSWFKNKSSDYHFDFEEAHEDVLKENGKKVKMVEVKESTPPSNYTYLFLVLSVASLIYACVVAYLGNERRQLKITKVKEEHREMAESYEIFRKSRLFEK